MIYQELTFLKALLILLFDTSPIKIIFGAPLTGKTYYLKLLSSLPQNKDILYIDLRNIEIDKYLVVE